MDSQSKILFHEILDVQKILVGWFFLALKFSGTVKKKHPVSIKDYKNIVQAGSPPHLELLGCDISRVHNISS